MFKIAPRTEFIRFTDLKTGRKARINCSRIDSIKYIGSRELFICSVPLEDTRVLSNGKPLVTLQDVAVDLDTVPSKDLIRLCRLFKQINNWVPGHYYWTLSDHPKTLHLRTVPLRHGFLVRLFRGLKLWFTRS